MGPSGSGKSTLMNLIGALDIATSGTLAIDGEELTDLGPDRLADLGTAASGSCSSSSIFCRAPRRWSR